MAGASLLALLDDIASVLDDVATLTKVATRKTAGVLGDDLALNAQQVSGISADRELPVVLAVAKGSAINKLILVPAALAISQFAPWAIVPLLMLGGLFLCYEGFEKIWHRIAHRDDEDAHRAKLQRALADPNVDLRAVERDRIKGAIRTDFILSAEIIVIALGTVGEATFGTRVGVLAAIAVIMTIGVYGLVAAIVKLDDAGLYLTGRTGPGGWETLQRSVGRAILAFAPWLMKLLSVAGTAAMFLVGGGILAHGIPIVHHFIADIAARSGGGWPGTLVSLAGDAVVGILAGAAAVLVAGVVRKLWPARAAAESA